MSFEELLANPEKYKTKRYWRATNKVFQVEFNGKKYIVKKPNLWALPAEAYYVFQDRFFYGTRRLTFTSERFRAEVKTLQKLDGYHAPKLIAHANTTTVREFLEGTDFRHLKSDKERERTLDGAVNAFEGFHVREVIADSHVKNCMLCQDGVYWFDFGEVYDKTDTITAKAVNLLRFIYSIYSATRDPDITIYSAELVKQRYQIGLVQDRIKELVTPGLSALRLWFPTRIPITGKLNEDIKKILRS